ncbi:hypothetical protein LJC58_03540 [Lachnospiraceae bacterium OttesenSCG-928-D06]|nr:hypothetical protein [Lachnospiraceae bacterium OttesenSCG-928-D06]
MKARKILALFMSTALCLSMLTGCSSNKAVEDSAGSVEESSVSVEEKTEETEETLETEEETNKVALSEDPLEMITQGYYIYAYPVEGLGDFPYFFHFYEEAPVLGSVFYAGFAMNQINFTGTYTVEEAEFEYACFATREDSEKEGAEPEIGTAPYTITFYDWEGNVMDRCGFDGEILYNDMEVITGVGGGPNFYTLDTEGESSKYYEFYEAEVGMAYLDFVAEEEVTSTLTLYHNGTYMDLVDMMVEGTWEMSTTEEGYEYVLTPASESDTPATLMVSEDSGAAIYTPDGKEGINMMNASDAGPGVFQKMAGETPIPGQEINADVELLLFSDGTCTLTASAFGQEMPLDAGTYSMGEDGFTITFTFDCAGEVVSVLEAETGQVSIQYVQEGTTLGDVDIMLAIVFE